MLSCLAVGFSESDSAVVEPTLTRTAQSGSSGSGSSIDILYVVEHTMSLSMLAILIIFFLGLTGLLASSFFVAPVIVGYNKHRDNLVCKLT